MSSFIDALSNHFNEKIARIAINGVVIIGIIIKLPSKIQANTGIVIASINERIIIKIHDNKCMIIIELFTKVIFLYKQMSMILNKSNKMKDGKLIIIKNWPNDIKTSTNSFIITESPCIQNTY